MIKTIPLAALIASLTLSACSKTAEEPEPAASTAPAIAASATPDPVRSDAAIDPAATSAPTASSEPTEDSASTKAIAANEIPLAIRGRWGLVAKDCTSKLGDAKGLLTVSAGQLKFYEAVAKLGKVQEAAESRIRATFRYSGEGQAWTQDVVLDAQDGGKTLIRRDYGPDALPGPQKYTRCT